jgi:uncharacterized protein (DUF924 family)/Ca2+-binding EF-hand superfamily protein
MSISTQDSAVATEGLQDEIIQFMFLRDGNGKLDVMKCLGLWFGKSNETDNEIQSRFGQLVAEALNGGFLEWKKSPRGCLALMILVDQFPRNIYRHTARSFDGDRIARRIVDAGHNWLEALEPEECLFVPCLIMTHQESIADQTQGLQFYETLEPHLPSELHIFRTIFEEHLRIISLCGTFPHRDHYFGRTTSDIGRELMENPKLRFDLPLIAKNGIVKFGHDPKKLWQAMQHAFDVLERIDGLGGKTTVDCGIINDNPRTPKEISECHEIFRAFDKDGNGYFDIEELAEVLESTGRTHEQAELQHIMDSITGIENSSRVTFDQFLALLQVKLDTDPTVRLKNRFNFFDIDGSGDISFEELKKCIQSLDSLVTIAEIKEMLEECDTDSNGSVSYAEFLAMVPLIMDRGQTTTKEVIPSLSDSNWVAEKSVEHISTVEVS